MTYTIFEILTNKARKWLIFLTPLLFDAPSHNRLEFSDETYLAKTRDMGLL